MVMMIIRRTPGFTSQRIKTISMIAPMAMVRTDRNGNGQGQGQEIEQGDGQHAAQHDEFSLGEIDDAGGVVDDVEADGDNGIDTAIGDAGRQVLDEKLDSHDKTLLRGRCAPAKKAGTVHRPGPDTSLYFPV